MSEYTIEEVRAWVADYFENAKNCDATLLELFELLNWEDIEIKK